MTDSPFLQIPPEHWIASNAQAFAIFDRFPVSSGHALVITRRLVPTWFDATPQEQSAMMQLVNEVKLKLDSALQPKPDGYNVGFNAGDAAGQTVSHLHVHVIPRYTGDVEDPRGGVRFVIPDKANYFSSAPGKSSASTSGAGGQFNAWPGQRPALPAAQNLPSVPTDSPQSPARAGQLYVRPGQRPG